MQIYLDIKGKGRVDSEEVLSKIDGENIIKLVVAFSENKQKKVLIVSVASSRWI